MKIGIDIDNTICSTTEAVLSFINKKLGLNLQLKNIKQYYIENALPHEYQWIVEFAFQSSEMWKQVKLIENCAAAIQKLYEDGHELYFVTATTAYNFRKKLKFLERSFPFLPKDYIQQNSISIKKKQLLLLDVLIDDCTENLLRPRNYCSICMDYPWNKDFKEDSIDSFRVKNWIDIPSVIKELNRQVDFSC